MLSLTTKSTYPNLLSQDFHFGPGTVTGYTPAAPNTTSFSR